ncbi:MAG: ATP phosphoribosyltransferase regulatory subunit [Gammaproteobacteria bacterium]
MVTPTDRWLLPAGVEEILPPLGTHLEQLRRKILDLFNTWGYELVIPPLIEYLESLLTGLGTDLDLETFKVTDQLTGRLMGIRADITPQIARIEAHRLRRETPTRLCYLGPVLRTLPQGSGGSRNPLQVGAELFGHSGLESDVEIIWLMLEVLKASNLAPVYADLGHVGIFRGLVRQAGLNPEQEIALFEPLQRKDRNEIDQHLSDWRVSQKVAEMIAALVDHNGDVSVLDQADSALAKSAPEVKHALHDLRQVYRAVRDRTSHPHWHFDLAELRGYHYHTGIVFAAYLPGQGQAIARGGRYDDIGRVFGRARPATGFSTDLKRLVSEAKPLPGKTIGAPWGDDPDLTAMVTQLRMQGQRVVWRLPGCEDQPIDYEQRLEHRRGRWVVTDI